MTPIRETWAALEELHARGLVKNIGVSNFNAQSIIDIFTYAKVPPCMLQVGMWFSSQLLRWSRTICLRTDTFWIVLEHHPYLVQQTLLDFCRDQGVLVTGYSSFGPQSFLELPDSFPTRAGETPTLFEVDLIKKLSAKYKKTAGQILLRWATQRGLCVIPKSSKEKRMLENLNVTNFHMEEHELQQIAQLDKGLRFNDPGTYLPGRPLRLFAWASWISK